MTKARRKDIWVAAALFALPLLALSGLPLGRIYRERQKQRLTRDLVMYAERHECFAGTNCYTKEIKALCLEGADVNAKMPNGEPLVRSFARRGFLSLAQHLKRVGARPDAEADRIIWRAYKESLNRELEYALYSGDLAHLSRVVARGADVNRRDDNGWTPLAKAIARREVRTVALLLSAGANPRAQCEGASYLSLVLRHARGYSGDASMLRMLKRAGAPTNPTIEMFTAVIEDRPPDVEKYLRAGISINTTNNGAPDNWTPLMWAAADGNARMVRFLLRHGADPNLHDGDGRTALDVAAADDKRTSLSISDGSRGDKPTKSVANSNFPEIISVLQRVTRS